MSNNVHNSLKKIDEYTEHIDTIAVGTLIQIIWTIKLISKQQ